MDARNGRRRLAEPRNGRQKLGTVLAALFLLGNVGCAAHRYDAYGNHYYDHQDHRSATEGAIIGGLAGAGIGRAISGHQHDEAGYWIGGALGAITGAVIGDTVDKQRNRDYREYREPHHDHGDYRKPPRGYGDHRQPHRDYGDTRDYRKPRRHAPPPPDPLVLRVPDEVLFAPGSARLSPGAKRRLRSVASTLRRYKDAHVVVRGHTDRSRAEGHRPELSEERAQVVRRHLIRHGVTPSRLVALGMGARFPVASNHSPEGRQRNRRAELEIRPGAAPRGHELAQLW